MFESLMIIVTILAVVAAIYIMPKRALLVTKVATKSTFEVTALGIREAQEQKIQLKDWDDEAKGNSSCVNSEAARIVKDAAKSVGITDRRTELDKRRAARRESSNSATA